MGSTYLVLLVAGSEPYSAALCLYSGTDEVEARNAYDKGVQVHSGQGNQATAHVQSKLYLTTVRAEARLS